MQLMQTQMLRWSRARTPAGFMLLAIVLSVLAGCASGWKAKTAAVDSPSPVAAAPTVPAGPVVARLTDGREGFVITEIPSLDAESRQDFERAIALMNDRDYGKAIELLEKVIERSPGVTAPYINLAIAYKHIDQPERAEEHLKTALGLVPEHPVASNEYGLLLRKAGRFAEARAVYEKTLATFPDYHPARRNLGILCDLYLHDQACALEQYEIYSEAMPRDEQVKIWVADLRARLKR